MRKIRWEQPSLPASTWSFQKLDFLMVFSLHDSCAVGSDLLATTNAIWSLNEQLVKQFLCFNVFLMIVIAALKAEVVKSSWILHEAVTALFSCASEQPLRGKLSTHSHMSSVSFSVVTDARLHCSPNRCNCTKDLEETKRPDPSHWGGDRGRNRGEREPKSCFTQM